MTDNNAAAAVKTLIVCTSVSHGNTRKVADTMSRVLDARVVEPEQVDVATLSDYDLVGFGSGIYLRSFHSQLREFVQSLPAGQAGRAFVFATSGFADSGIHKFSRPMVASLLQKGFHVVGTFSCRAFDTYLPFKLVGGLRKGRPNTADFHAATSFAERLLERDSATI